MFYKYTLTTENNKDVLYLYLTRKINNKTKLREMIDNYLINKNLAFKGEIIYIIVDEKINDIIYYNFWKQQKNQDFEIILKKQDNSLISLSMTNYLLGVMASECIPTFEKEALKALAVIYRTYAFKEMLENGYIKEINEVQIYQNITKYKFIWLENYREFFGKIYLAIEDTKGEYLAYHGTMIKPYFHLAGNGKTETKEDDYLISVSSVWDLDDKLYLSHFKIKKQDAADNLNVKKEELNNIEITEKKIVIALKN